MDGRTNYRNNRLKLRWFEIKECEQTFIRTASCNNDARGEVDVVQHKMSVYYYAVVCTPWHIKTTMLRIDVYMIVQDSSTH